MTTLHRILLTLVLSCAALVDASGQISVDLHFNRTGFLRYEPILATIGITNLSGRDIVLEDGSSQWFGFEINEQSGSLAVGPRNPFYKLEPLEIKAGASLKRTVNLNTLFPINELGRYRVKGVIYFKELDRYFGSKPAFLDIFDGQVMWRQNVGVPPGQPNAGDTHSLSILTSRMGEHQYTYARVEDPRSGFVFCTYRLGQLIHDQPPQMQVDAANNLFVLQFTTPRAYLLSKISPNGEFLGQTNYTSSKSRPYLRRLPSGELQIVGGIRQAPTTPDAIPTEMIVPKISDRPPGLPPAPASNP